MSIYPSRINLSFCQNLTKLDNGHSVAKVCLSMACEDAKDKLELLSKLDKGYSVAKVCDEHGVKRQTLKLLLIFSMYGRRTVMASHTRRRKGRLPVPTGSAFEPFCKKLRDIIHDHDLHCLFSNVIFCLKLRTVLYMYT